MKIDLALILTVLSALAGVIWLLDSLLFARKRRLAQAEGEDLADPVAVEYAKSLFPILLLVLGLRSFVAEPFRIPSASMMPTLLVGDFIVVNKFTYGLRLPVLNTKVLSLGSPERGDVVVFRFPGLGPDDPQVGEDYIKRVVGLPGDEVAFENQTVYLNGVPVAKQPLGLYVGSGWGREMTGSMLLEHQLPGHSHQILLASEYGDPRLSGRWTVPAGSYFVMGDNRDHSSDSRVWGFVPEQALAGRAFMIWLNCEGWLCSKAFDYARIGDTIR